MNNFKLQYINQLSITPPPQATKPTPKLTINIQSIPCLNYPIDTLCQILYAHFDQQSCGANIVVRALKVISISLKDKQLRNNIQNIISQNMHKRQKIYQLFVYWTSIMSKLTPTLSKLSSSIVQNAIGCVISYYSFTNTTYNSSICQLITHVINQFSMDSCHRIGQYVKNQYMSMNASLEQFMYSIGRISINNEKVYNFYNDIAYSILKHKQSQTILQQNITKYFQTTQTQQKQNQKQKQKQKLDKFFLTFPNLQTYLTRTLLKWLQNKKQQVLNIWVRASNHKLHLPIRSCIREFVNHKYNYWVIFDYYYNLLTNANTNTNTNDGITLYNLLQLGIQIQQDNTLPQTIIKKYIYNYLSNTITPQQLQQLQLQTKQITTLYQNKQIYKILHNSMDTLQDMHKCISNNIINDGQVSIMYMNTIHAPKYWQRTPLQQLQNNRYKPLQPYIKKLLTLHTKLCTIGQKKGQKIQLVYHGIKIMIDNEPASVLVVSYQQLISIFKNNRIINRDIREYYTPVPVQQSILEVKRQVSSIVVQARIVKLLKKSKQKLSIAKIYSQIKQQLQITQQSCKLAMDKVIGKGMAIQQPQGLYIYCP